MSQLQLSAAAETTPRHLSFIETGRSRPGQELVLRLARCLELPIRDQNSLLTAAGLSPVYPEHTLDADELRLVNSAIRKMLEMHSPYPASAMNGLGKVLISNEAAQVLFPGAEERTPLENIEGFLSPGPGRGLVRNFPTIAWAMVDRMRREAARTRDPRLPPLIERAVELLRDVKRPAPESFSDAPVMNIELQIGDTLVRCFVAVMHFENAAEVTASEIRVEFMFPSDAASEAFFRDLLA